MAGATMIAPACVSAEMTSSRLDLADSAIVISGVATVREHKAAQVFVEEASKRCGITWPIGNTRKEGRKTTIYLATRESLGKLAQPNLISTEMLQGLKPEVFEGDRKKAEAWLNQLLLYFFTNRGVASLQSEIDKVSYALTSGAQLSRDGFANANNGS